MIANIIPIVFSLFPLTGKDLASLERELSVERFLARVKLLASEDLEGRATGSPGQKAAATYVANQFRKAGLEPAGDEKGYFQRFATTIHRPARIGKGSRFAWKSVGEERVAEPRALMPFAFSKKGEAKGPIVFAGYSISSKELDYDDYAGIDVKGKIVLCLRHSPGEAKPDSRFGPVQMKVATFVNKAKAAAAAGAAALLLANDANHEDDEMIALGVSGEPADIPVMQIRRDEAERLLRLAGKELAAVQKEIDEALKPRSFLIEGVEVGMVADIEPGLVAQVETENVVGLLRGSDPEKSKECVVIGAHLDHVGYGDYGAHPKNRGQIHYGADDNASGTSALIELAAAFAAMEPKPKRSLLFLAFSAEEVGLFGSAHYVKHPAFPLKSTALMLNLDMIGRSQEGRCEVSGVGTAEELEGLIAAQNEGIGLDLKFVPQVSADSDHYSFAKSRIPIAFFFTGFHADYHQPGDTWEKINGPDSLRVIQLCLRVANEAANAESRMRFAGMEEK